MEIFKLHLSILRNEEHYKFHLDVMGLVNRFDPTNLGISPLFANYLSVIGIEANVLDVVRGSAFTDKLTDADAGRDNTYSGMAGIVKSALNHFNPEVMEAAERLKKLFDTYGNLAEKPLDQETAGIFKLVGDLRGNYLNDATIVGITDWTEELNRRNESFDELKNSRYAENALKPQDNMKLARQQTDKVYKAMAKLINALIEVNGEAVYAGFVNELNQRIVNYNTLLAQRQGRNAKDATEKDTIGK